MMNREQRRKYIKQIKNYSLAGKCPKCNNISRFFTARAEDETPQIMCEVCLAPVVKDKRLEKIFPQGIYVMPKLIDKIDEIFEKYEQEEKKNVLEGNSDSSAGEASATVE